MVICVAGFSGCGRGDVHVASAAQDSSQVRFFQGEHQLVPFNNDPNCGYVSFDGSTYRFYWRNNNTGSDFAASFAPHEVSFVTNEMIPAPLCEFRWNKSSDFKEYDWRIYATRVFISGKAEHIIVEPKMQFAPLGAL
jgi:hypothetical protein